jgi:hypothetical protein
VVRSRQHVGQRSGGALRRQKVRGFYQDKRVSKEWPDFGRSPACFEDADEPQDTVQR